MNVFLSGSIDVEAMLPEEPYLECQWRKEAYERFQDRSKEFNILSAYNGPPITYTNSVEIVRKCRHLLKLSDLLIFNVGKAKEIPIGSISEVAWAYEKNIPIIGVRGTSKNAFKIMHHPFMNGMVSFWVDEVRDAVNYIIGTYSFYQP